MQYYNDANAATLNQYFVVRTLIAHAEPIMAVSKFGETTEQPQNKTDTILFSRVLPIGYDSTTGGINVTPTAYQMTEGQTPTPITIAYQDVTATLQKFGVLYKTTEKTELMNERSIPENMRETAAEGVGSIKEMVTWNAIKGGTNVVYSNGSTRAGINTPISANALDKAAEQILAAHGKMVTKMVKAGSEYGSQGVLPCMLAFGHTDCEHDYRALANFKDVVDYGSSTKPVHEMEIGSVRRFRIILTPMLKPFASAGSATLNGMKFTTSNVNVYPTVVMAAKAYGHVPLKGRDSMTPFVIPSSQRNHANPSAQFGYVGVDFYTVCVRLNEFFMTRIEHASTSL